MHFTDARAALRSKGRESIASSEGSDLLAMAARAYRVLFICTGNSARSILAEALLNHWGHGRFSAFSAGIRPAKMVNRYVLELLEQQHISTDALYSKSWKEFTAPRAPQMDCIIILSKRLPQQRQPAWRGHPVAVHWGMHDPASVSGSAATKRRTVLQTFELLQERIRYLVSLPVERLDWEVIREELDSIAKLPAHIDL